jgi:hypothetical protein
MSSKVYHASFLGDRLAHYSAVLRLIPNNPTALDGLAVALRAARRDDEADAVLGFGTRLGFWPSEFQRPSSLVPGLRARPWQAAGLTN